jgi:UDP-2-acetamido-2,6-beta-L-arabino-hexul-4-ose reductase
MTVLLTGASGFLGWHIRCRAAAAGIEVLPASKGWVDDPRVVDSLLSGVTGVIHAAGVNRGTDDEVATGNERAGGALAEALNRAGRNIVVVYANSSQAGSSSVYGRAKARVADVLSEAGTASSVFFDVRLDNLFGEHGRPDYNSFVATFCDRLACGRTFDVVDREVPLLHVQEAARHLLELVTSADPRSVVAPSATVATVSEVARFLSMCASTYRTGEIPPIHRPIERQLFSTLRSFCFPSWYPIATSPKSDVRGRLVECVRARTPEGQTFVSTTIPGATRGEHYHLRKLERFMVVEGEATISLRRLFSDEVIRFNVSGSEPAMIDMPCMWTHKIQNTGSEVVTTLFWTDELFDPSSADTHPCPVDSSELSS